ncbi:DUF268 domain-containing protein [Geomonas agri]|uniref:DUF268 domain-containing protein n=1 Tax=Geomonas agri TaxID=2873702 RepID=UPI001CD3A097|nr:DUF268 domain-containing protein [Geomonas agri]
MQLELKKRACFIRDFCRYRILERVNGGRFPVLWQDRYPCLHDNTGTTGFDRHYVYHLAWAARVLAQIRPEEHYDISSSLYFATMVSAFIKVSFFDYRPAELQLSGLTSNRADLLSLPFADASVRSLSCMHVVEHVGLGRYGDRLDPEGDLKAAAELKRVLAPGGDLLFVVPIGKPRIAFNAHRIYSYDQVVSYFGELNLQQFALIPDDAQGGGIVTDAARELADAQNYGCGCFWFRKEGA